MDDLQIVLIIIVSFVIIALFIHGFWINKKERSSVFESKKKPPITDPKKANITINAPKVNTKADVPVQQDLFANTKAVATSKITASIETEQEPAQEKIKDELQKQEAVKEPEVKITLEVEPVAEAPAQVEQEYIQEEKPQEELKPEAPKQKQPDVLVLHIKSINDEAIAGTRLESALLLSGFKFGDMNIYHYHKDSFGEGPAIFSLANMVKPGTFDLDNMHEFETVGVTIFMMIPSKGNTEFNFKLMLKCAQRISNDVHGIVLDDNRKILTPQKIDEYKERIKIACS